MRRILYLLVSVLMFSGIGKAVADEGMWLPMFIDRLNYTDMQKLGLQLTAEEIINNSKKDDLADIFYYFGEERQARRIAAHIVEERGKERITSTAQLAHIIAWAIPKKFHPRRIHVATKVFQALRIAVNKELDNLATILDLITKILKPGGRVCIITFHSLEDRLVKWKFRDNPLLHVLTNKSVTPSDEEIKMNFRSRSAKLRAAYMKG